jgi:hypothetical protein
MKSILIDKDIHHYLKILSGELDKSIKFLLCEAIVLLFKKYDKQIPENLRVFYDR